MKEELKNITITVLLALLISVSLALYIECSTHRGKALSYYKGSVVIAQDAKHCTAIIDTKGIKNTISVTDFEYKIYNLGDTIK